MNQILNKIFTKLNKNLQTYQSGFKYHSEWFNSLKKFSIVLSILKSTNVFVDHSNFLSVFLKINNEAQKKYIDI